MRTAVYNRFLQSKGGGERHSGMLAQVLAEDGNEVDLIGPDRVDLGELGEHLGLDLAKVRLRVVPDYGDEHLAQVSAEYDLFVNASYMSRLRPRARHNLYLCYFPTPVDHDLARWRRRAIRLLAPVMGTEQPGTRPTYGLGWFPPEGGLRRTYIWTSGEAELRLPAGRGAALSFELGRPGASEPTVLHVEEQGGRELLAAEARPGGFRRVTIPLPHTREGMVLRLRSESFRPGPDDQRSLGVAISRLRLAGVRRGPRERLGERFPWLLRDARDLRFLQGYDRVLANSEYTRGWVQRYWGQDSDVLFPPIRVGEIEPAAQRERRILTVGRFFQPGHGHSKKQLELVQAFGRMVGRGGLDGWTLHVVGGVEDRQLPYLQQVQRAAESLPVEVHPNAPRSLVRDLFATSSVFWVGTGFGEDVERSPWAFEHFGITTVEAMAAGCVPVVIDQAGQKEIVRPGVDGFRWADLDALETYTREVIGDESLRMRLAAAARERAQAFSETAFADQWRGIARGLGLEAAVTPQEEAGEAR